MKRMFRRLFPPALRPVRRAALIPLIAFYLLLATACGTLVLMQKLEFARPWAFALLIVTPWIWWMQAAGHGGLPAVRGAVACFCRLVICGLLVLALAEPRSVRTSDVVSVVYSVDVSDSVNEARNSALNLVAETAAEKPATDQAGLVVFGRTAAVEYPPRETFPFEEFINSRVGQDATNLEQSLALSAAMLPEENNGRIVLISDGTETVGQLKDVIDDLDSRGIQVDVVPIEYDYKHEVLLERLDLPRFVRLGETYDASVVLSSLAKGRGTLVLSQGDQILQRLDVDFQQGKSRYTIPIKVDQPGYYEYSARIEVPHAFDSRPENNEVRNYLYIDGPGRIMVVTDPQGDANEWSYFRRALEQGERQIEVVNALEFPIDPLSLMPFDAVIFADVAADSLTGIQMQAMHDAVRNLGIGFLMVGGPNSFGPGGYQGSVIEDALPISMEITNKKVLPKGSLVIILHTCEFPSGNTWAKRITKKAIQVLSSEDLVGALAYGSGGEEWIFEMTPAGEYASLVPKVNAAQIGDMPDFAATMRMGLKGLVDSDASSRHMIIISDGDANPPPEPLIKEFLKNEVSVSTVAIFPHDGNTQTLEMIAGVTGGRFYFPSDPNQLPSIFIKEAKTLRRSQVQKRSFVPSLKAVDPMIRDIGVPPELHGYILTSPKDDPRATIILSAPPGKNDAAASDGDDDPILAVWRYGLGVTAAFTSDLTTRWGTDWLKWDQFQQLVNQMITRIGRVRREQFLRVYTYTNGNEGVVVVEDFHQEESLLDVTVTVSGPNAFQTTQPVRQIAPRRYQTSMPLKGEGRYQVQINAMGSDRKETAYAGFIVSYSPEYLRFRANPIVMREIAERTHGTELNVSETPQQLAGQIFGDRKPKRSSQPVFDWLLMALACMIPLDVGIRRVQIDPAAVFRIFRRRRTESTATLGTLLQKTEELRSSLSGGSEGSRSPDSPPRPRPAVSDGPRMPRPATRSEQTEGKGAPAGVSGAGSAPGTPSAADESPARPEGTADGSTTSRLLALKRKREQEGGQENKNA